MSRNQPKSGRVLSRSISLSESMADLQDPAYILVATWLIPHCDDQGRMPASARKIKAQVFPMLDSISADTIREALAAMQAVGMIALYAAPDGPLLLQFLNWWKWNDGQRWIYPSNFPAPEGWTDRERVNSQDVPQPDPAPVVTEPLPVELLQPAEVGGSLPQDSGGGDGVGEGVGSLEEELGGGTGAGAGEGAPPPSAPTPPPVTSDPFSGSAFAAYEQNIGLLTPLVAEQIAALIDEFNAAWFIAAVGYACRQSKRSLSYIDGTMQGWRRDGLSQPPPVNAGRGKPQPGESTATLDLAGPDLCQQMRAGPEAPNLRPVCQLEWDHPGPHQGTYRGDPVTWAS